MFSCVVHACPTCTLIYCFIPQYHDRNYFRFRVGREGGREGHNIYSTLLSLVILLCRDLTIFTRGTRCIGTLRYAERERKVQNSLVYLMPIGSQHTTDWWWRCEARWGRIVVFFGFSGVIASCYCCSFFILADFGIAAQLTQTLLKRKSFIGTPYWFVKLPCAILFWTFLSQCLPPSRLSTRLGWLLK